MIGQQPEQDTLVELRRWLAGISAITEAVNASSSLRTVLDLVARTGRSLLSFDFCAVLLPDADGQNLVITGWSGLSGDYVTRVNADRPVRLTTDDAHQAPSSRAFRGGHPVAIRDIAAEPEFTPWGGVAREQGYGAMVSVPLVAGGTVVGTLNGYHAGVHEFGEHEIDRMTLLANHAAIALTSARLVDQLQSVNDSLLEQTQLLTKSEQIHQQLLGVALSGDGMPGIAAALSTVLGRSVLIEDVRNVVLGRAGTPDELPDMDFRAATAIDRDSRSPLQVQRDGAPRFLVWTVHLEGEPVARVWLGVSDFALSTIDGRAVEHASIVLSLEMMRSRTAVEVEHRLRGELMADILSGSPIGTQSLRERAERLGHDLSRAHVAIVGRVTAVDSQRISVIEQRSMAAVAQRSAHRSPRPLVAMYRGLLVTLWPVDDEPAPDVGARAGDEVRRVMAGARGVATATVAVAGSTTADFLRNYRTARGALQIATRSGRMNQTLTLPDLGMAGLLLQLDDADQLISYADRTLREVRRHDEQRGTHLLQTLRCYLDHQQNRTATGDALHVHPNTVTQRLQRIQAISGVDLTEPEAVLQVRGALLLLDVANADHAV